MDNDRYLHKAAETHKENFKAFTSQMKYIDLHCDTLTECLKTGEDFGNGGLQVSLDKLKKSDCAAQCFAIFTEGEGAADFFYKTLDYYGNMLEKHADKAVFIQSAKQLKSCLNGDKTGCILTVENLGFTGGNLQAIKRLADKGVKMASLVWNHENFFAYPNVIFSGGIKQVEKRETRGLKRPGKEAVEALDDCRVIVDISHLSDGGAEDILKNRKIPVVASHSNATAVCNVSRNLTDNLIKKIAGCGGVIGVNFCKNFLGGDDAFSAVLRHINHLIKAGGEDVIALGSDFDGIKAPPRLCDCTRVPALLKYLEDNGITARVLEKFAYGNFLRVFEEVCG